MLLHIENCGMTEKSSSEERTLQRLDLFDGYLDDAEDVLWNISNEVSSAETAAELDDLLEDLWEIQNRVSELQQTGEKSATEQFQF